MSIKLNAPKALPLLHAAGKLIVDAAEMQPATEAQRFALEMRGCHLHQGTDAAPQEMRTAACRSLDLMWEARKVLVGDASLPEPLATHFAEIDDGLRSAWSGGGSYDDVLWDVEGASEAFTEFMASFREICPLYRVAEHRADLAPTP